MERVPPLRSTANNGRRSRRGRSRPLRLGRRLLRENGLSLALIALFLAFLTGQALAGRRKYNDEQLQHGERPVSFGEYLTRPDFAEAMFENRESEFLEMGCFVLLTVFLRQKGSAESKRLEGEEDVDDDPPPAPSRPERPGSRREGRARAQALRALAEPRVLRAVPVLVRDARGREPRDTRSRSNARKSRNR